MELWRPLLHELGRCCDLLLPPACLLCGDRLRDRHSAPELCPSCVAAIPPVAPARCPVCAAAFHSRLPSSHHCESCLRTPPLFDRAHAVGPYAGTLQEAIRHFKYRGRLALERPLGRLLAQTVQRAAGRLDLIVPVPLHVNRLRERGFNQSLQLARQVGKRLSLPVEARLLRRIRATPSQQGLDAATRKHNLRGAFAVSRRLSGRHVLLIDDVMTTSATARECAAVLRAAGAAAVEVAVIGRA